MTKYKEFFIVDSTYLKGSACTLYWEAMLLEIFSDASGTSGRILSARDVSEWVVFIC
jgi:hypothetical protein